MLKPLINKEKINNRLNTIEYLNNNIELSNILNEIIKGIKDIPNSLLRIKLIKWKYNDWLNIYELIYKSNEIYNIIKILNNNDNNDNDNNNIEIINKINNIMNNNEIIKIQIKFEEIFDIKLSKEEKKLIILKGYDIELDELKDTYDNINNFLLNISNENENEKYKYIPQLGFLLEIKKEDINNINININKNKNNIFIFENDKYIYYNNNKTNELNDYFGDLYSIIIDKETKIICEMEEYILNYEELILNISEYISELDCYLSLSKISIEFKMSKPIIIDDDNEIIYIKEGKHPLQELTVENIISNDTIISKEKNSIINIICGPNYSGKSIYLKQVGIIVYLCHIGSFIPAKKGIISIIDKIFTRISSYESILINESTFSIDLIQISKMLKYSTKKSLLLIDEFGKGTKIEDGISLLLGLLNNLLSKNRKFIPKTIIISHYISIINDNILLKSNNILLLQMKMLINNNKIIPLFKLIPGISIESYAYYCAKESGLSNKIIERGKEISNCLLLKKKINKIKIENKNKNEEKYKKIIKFINENKEWNEIILKEFLKIIN